MLGIFVHEKHLISCFKTWWADCSPWKEAIVLFFIFFLALLGVLARNFGTISVFQHFLHNGLWDLAEIWPEASLDVSACFPATFPAINEFPFLLVGFGCPRLYCWWIWLFVTWLYNTCTYNSFSSFLLHYLMDLYHLTCKIQHTTRTQSRFNKQTRP